MAILTKQEIEKEKERKAFERTFRLCFDFNDIWDDKFSNYLDHEISQKWCSWLGLAELAKGE